MPDRMEPVVLEVPSQTERTWTYPWIGLLAGVGLGVLTGHPLAMVVYNLHEYVYGNASLDVWGSLIHSFHLHMWPMIIPYVVLGGLVGALVGRIFQLVRQNRLRLDTLHQEFEFQVATLRHHYKNLAIGIHGFSGRIRRKLAVLEEEFRRCAEADCPTYNRFGKEYEPLARNAATLEEASQRLTHVLGQELLFLKALTSDTMVRTPRDLYPLLIHSIEDLLGMRFREKEIKVEIDGQPFEKCRGSLVFPFEPYTMEVILQNILSNALRYGDLVQIKVSDSDDRVRVEIKDNGPGLELETLKSLLQVPPARREAESSHLGLKVSIHLLEKAGGRLLAWSKPGAGAVFIVEVPKQP
ncbi:MAG: HAMP domain-containing sensor histidine kinase [Deltaproteobacteria bacterium]|nr:HAMP domain-containing sensor histidine kinase [Deltaproteobacteria bacterium]